MSLDDTVPVVLRDLSRRLAEALPGVEIQVYLPQKLSHDPSYSSIVYTWNDNRVIARGGTDDHVLLRDLDFEYEDVSHRDVESATRKALEILRAPPRLTADAPAGTPAGLRRLAEILEEAEEDLELLYCREDSHDPLQRVRLWVKGRAMFGEPQVCCWHDGRAWVVGVGAGTPARVESDPALLAPHVIRQLTHLAGRWRGL